MGRTRSTLDRSRISGLIHTGLALAMILALTSIAAQPLDRYTTFKNMLGRDKTQSSVRITIKQLGAYNVEKLEPANAEYYYSFPKRGVELHFDAGHRVEFAVLANERAFAPYTKYAGTLPDKITFADDEAAVTQKAGKAARAETVAGAKERVLFYNKKGFSVVFSTDGPLKGKIKYVEIYSPK